MEVGLLPWPNLTEPLLIPPVLSLLSQSQKVCLKELQWDQQSWLLYKKWGSTICRPKCSWGRQGNEQIDENARQSTLLLILEGNYIKWIKACFSSQIPCLTVWIVSFISIQTNYAEISCYPFSNFQRLPVCCQHIIGFLLQYINLKKAQFLKIQFL